MNLRQCHTLFSKNETIKLLGDRIERVRDGRTIRSILIKNIRSIHVVFEGYSKAHEKNVYRCIIGSDDGKIAFSNALFGGKDKSAMDEQYTKMVRAIHGRVREGGQKVKMLAGSNVYLVMAWLLLILGSILLLGLPVAFVVTGDFWRLLSKAWVFLAIAFGILGTAIPLIKRGGAKQYTTGTAPNSFLPGSNNAVA